MESLERRIKGQNNWPKDIQLPTREEGKARLPDAEKLAEKIRMASKRKAPGYVPGHEVVITK